MNGHTSDQAMDLLREGNARFLAATPQHTRTTSELLAETAAGQTPFAAVLACADSRVPIELIFDRGVGDLFVVRVAGNTIGPLTEGSIEFAVAQLGVPLVLVLGHTSCGAVGAAMNGESGLPSKSLGAVVRPILPSCEDARAAHPGEADDELVDYAAAANAVRQARSLVESSEIVRSSVERGEIRVVSAIYDLATGEVRWL